MAIQEETLLNLFVATFGLLIGSFLNVIIYRLPRNESLIRPGSHCTSCGYSIRWYQNIPILSYLLLRGKCSGCGIRISLRYPVVEALTALLFLAVYHKFGLGVHLLIRDFPFVCLLVVICFIDLDHRIIPDRLSLSGLVLGLITALFLPGFHFIDSVVGAVFGFLVFYVPAFLYLKLRGRMGLGGGDIKFLAMLGAFIGVFGVLTTVLISSVLGSVIGIVLGVIQKNSKETQSDSASVLKLSIPFGPFLVIGALYTYLLSDILWSPFMNLM